MQANDESYEAAERRIQTEYVDKAIQFLRGDQKRICSAAEYMKVFEVVMHQCDSQDNGERLYNYVQKIVLDYI